MYNKPLSIQANNLHFPCDEPSIVEYKQPFIQKAKYQTMHIMATGNNIGGNIGANAFVNFTRVQARHVPEHGHGELPQRLGKVRPPGVQLHVGGVVQVFVSSTVQYILFHHLFSAA
jgi:hypothetical protein